MVYDPAAFDWGDDSFEMPARDDVVIYELHVGTFSGKDDRRGTFDTARRRLGYLRQLGVSAVQVMPPFEFAGDISWGYNPAHLFAIETSYGGPDAFKRFIRDAHAHGIAVIVDVVYNHVGPSDLDLWRFDGWSENDGGGIYLYNDERALTPWGSTRPDYGRGEVRTFLRDSAMTWLEEFRCDGLRFDSTVYVRSVNGDPGDDGSALADGWSFMAWINDEIRARQPWKLTIAEDLQDDPAVVAPTEDGGAGFGAQWDAGFVYRVRQAVIASDDADRDMDEVVVAILGEGRGSPLARVIYTESHDEVANGQVRVPEAIAPGDARQLVGDEARGPRIGARPHVTRDPDAVPGPGAARGPLVRRHSRARLGQGELQQRDPAPAPGPDRAPARGGRRDPGPARLERGDPARRQRGQAPRDAPLARGRAARRHRRDRELRRSDRGRLADRVCRRPDAGPSASNSDAIGLRARLRRHEAFDIDADGEPMDGCAQSGLVAVGPYSVVILSRET